MQLYINSISADKILRCKRSADEILKHITLVNPQYYEGEVLFDVHITLPYNYIITSKYEGKAEHLYIQLSNLGSMELDVMDFRSITLCLGT